MEITHTVENEILVLSISERLDAATAPIAEETIKKTLNENTSRLLFDVSGFTSMIPIKNTVEEGLKDLAS